MTLLSRLNAFAKRIESAHNERSAHNPDIVDVLEFTGNTKRDIIKRELLPNPKNPALMDTCQVTYYSAEFINTTRGVGKKRSTKRTVWYYCGQDVERMAVGSHYDNGSIGALIALLIAFVVLVAIFAVIATGNVQSSGIVGPSLDGFQLFFSIFS